MNVIRIENSQTLQDHMFSKKTLVLLITWSKCGNNNDRIFKEDKKY